MSLSVPLLGPAGASAPSSQATARTVRWNVDAFLAGATLALFPLGNLVLLFSGADVPIPAYFVPFTLLAFNLVVRAMVPGTPPYVGLRPTLKLLFIVMVMMGVAQATHGLGGSGGFAFSLFVVGTSAGALVGVVWAAAAKGLGWVDIGAAAAILVSVVELAGRFAAAGSPSGFHRAAVLSWGGSNYIAGVLVVVSLTMASRIRELGYRPILLLIPFAGVAVAGLTFSRGALIAAGAGLLVLFWNVGRSSAGRGVLRTLGLLTAAAAAPVMQYVVASRSAGGFDPSQNVRIRFELARVALRDFQTSPLFGTGWLSMRDARLSAVEISYAHNLFPSFLQIAGLVGGVFLVLLLFQSLRALRRNALGGAAIVAALAISMSDPFFEGGIGAMVAWAAITRATYTRDYLELEQEAAAPAPDPAPVATARGGLLGARR